MEWILIITGFFLTIIGGFLKYQQFRSGNPSLIIMDEKDRNKKKYNKLEKTNNELDKLISSIDEKEKMISEKLNSILELEKNLENRLKKKQAEENVKNNHNNFRKILNKEYQELNNDINTSSNNRYNLVHDFAKKGMNAEEIAEKLALGIRETRLILKLYRKEEDFIV